MLEYDFPSSNEESADDETAYDVGEIPSFRREAKKYSLQQQNFVKLIILHFLVVERWDCRHLLFFLCFC